LPLGEVDWVVCALPVTSVGVASGDPRSALIRAVRAQGYDGRIAVALHRESERALLVARGADIFLHPFEDAADQAVDLLVGKDRPSWIEVIEPENQRDLVS
jgi:hypothetical protein